MLKFSKSVSLHISSWGALEIRRFSLHFCNIGVYIREKSPEKSREICPNYSIGKLTNSNLLIQCCSINHFNPVEYTRPFKWSLQKEKNKWNLTIMSTSNVPRYSGGKKNPTSLNRFCKMNIFNITIENWEKKSATTSFFINFHFSLL